ncbi:hypothetical protein [Shigella sp. FC1737]|uniref:hypothetical protein n=1 Tax=Shigella sp. FC1737 TaxID=1898040 RepID=UPI000B0CF3A5|nr:hypothetical protein [Shigella sp. FC1737]
MVMHIQIYFDNENHLNDIKENKCKNCHHDYVGLPPPAEYRKIFLSSINEKWKIKDKIKKFREGGALIR